jgi:hypothetical protein
MTSHATPAAIRQLFLSPSHTYAIADAASLLGMEVEDLRGWLNAGEIEGMRVDDAELVVPWSELVFFGMDFWSQEVVEAALGAEVAQAIPELVRLTELEVRIPRLQVVTLERLAERDGETVSGVLARELRDLVSVHAPWLSAEVAGFAEALAWPDDV